MGLTGDVVMHDLAKHILKCFLFTTNLLHWNMCKQSWSWRRLDSWGGTHVQQQLHVLEVNALVQQVGHVLRVNTRVQQRLLWESAVQEQNFKS